MSDRKSGAWHDLPDRWRRTNRATLGNREEVLKATAKRVTFKGGEKCPAGCGSIIAYQVGMPPKRSVDRHTSNPRACMNHPDNRRKPKR
jgi:hypothetical protein